MLTGDKGETAHNIAISCGLIDPAKHAVYEIREEMMSGIEKEIGFIENKVKGKGKKYNVISPASDQSAKHKASDAINEVEMGDLKLTK